MELIMKVLIVAKEMVDAAHRAGVEVVKHHIL
jgi:sialic acid synthase SpsE